MVKIILLAIFIRLFLLGSVPPSLNWDEVSQGYTAYSILQTGRDEWGEKLPIFFRSYGEWKSAVYIYLLVPFIKVLGLNVYSVRLPSAIFGLISVYLMYLLGKKLYSEKVGLWSAFLMSVTPWAFMLGRPGFEANVALTLFLGGLYLFLTKNYFWSAILFGLSPHAYNSAKIVVPLLVLYLIWSTKLYKNLKSTLVLLVTLAVFAFPLLVNLVSGHSQARYTQVGITTDQESLDKFYSLRSSLPLPNSFDKVVINKASFFVYQFSNNFLSYLSPGFLAWHGGDHTQQSLPYHGVLYFTEFIFVMIGLFAVFRAKGISPRLPLILIFLGIIPAAMTRDPEHVLRALLAISGFILLAALGVHHVQNTSTQKLSKWFIGILIIEIIAFLAIYFTWYPRAYARDWQYGYPQISTYLKEHESEYDQIVVTKWFGEPQLFLAFYGQWDPLWYQKENQQNLRYESEGSMWLDQLQEYTLGKYVFKYISWSIENRSKRTLYIGKFDDFDSNAKIEETIRYPDGTVAFLIVQGDK